jgi:hypothetical protein
MAFYEMLLIGNTCFSSRKEVQTYMQLYDNAYSKLGKRLRSYALITIVYFLLNLIETYVISIGFAGFISILVLVFQILIIIDAKKAAKQFKKPELERFGNFQIGALILGFVAIGIIFIISFQIVFAELMGYGSGIVDLVSIMVMSVIIDLCTSFLVLVSWLAFAAFFKNAQEVDIRSFGLPGIYFVITSTIIGIANAVAISLPTAILHSTGMFQVIGFILGIAFNVLAIIGYFKTSDAMARLGSLAIERGPVESTTLGTTASFPPSTPAPGERSLGRVPSRDFARAAARSCPPTTSRFNSVPIAGPSFQLELLFSFLPARW